MQTQTQLKSNNQITISWQPDPFPAIETDQCLDWMPDPVAIDSYQADGATILRGAFEDWVDPLRAGLQRNMKHPQRYAFPCESVPDGAPGRFFDSYCNWLLIPEYLEHITRSCAASMAGQLMQSEKAQFFHEHAFCKEPGTQHATPWHQDLPYYCVDGRKTVSLYIALDSSPADVAVQFIRGSHLWQRLFQPVAFLDGARFEGAELDMEIMSEVDADLPGQDILAWDLEPGDCIAFNFRTVHGTTANEVKTRRRAVSTRWLGDDVVYCKRNNETSPSYSGLNLVPGDSMRSDWFPILWSRS